jgi:hypothetical protein
LDETTQRHPRAMMMVGQAKTSLIKIKALRLLISDGRDLLTWRTD